MKTSIFAGLNAGVLIAFLTVGAAANSNFQRLKPYIAEKQLSCLQQNIFYEARNQSELGQRAVAWVTLNRVEDERFPSTVCKVVYQKNQFSWTRGYDANAPVKNIIEEEAWERAGEIAESVFIRWSIGVEDPTDGADHYHADRVNPSWVSAGIQTTKVDDHIFYRVEW